MKSIELKESSDFKKGDLVECVQGDGGRYVVLITFDKVNDLFEGVVLFEHRTTYSLGQYSNCWLKRVFKKYNGKIEIQNE